MQSERPSRSETIPPPSGRDYQFYDVLKTNSCFQSLGKTTHSLTALQRICSRASCVAIHVYTPNLCWFLLIFYWGECQSSLCHISNLLSYIQYWMIQHADHRKYPRQWRHSCKNPSRLCDCKIAKTIQGKTILSSAAVQWPAVALTSQTEMIRPAYTLWASSVPAEFVQERLLKWNREKIDIIQCGTLI